MIKPVTKKQLSELDKTVRVHLIDIRSKQEYETQHISTAVNIPAEDLSNVAGRFSKADMLVCIGNHGKERSQAAAEYLYRQGFEKAFYLEGGTSDWLAGEQKNFPNKP